MIKELRFNIVLILIKIIIKIVDKKTIEGMALIVAIDGWIKYLEEQKESKIVKGSELY